MGTTLYLFTTFMQLAPHAVNGALWWILALGFSAWLLGKARHPSARKWFRIVGQSMALTIVLTTGFSFIDLSEKSVSPIVSFEEADILERIDGGEAIFLEFTAQWCTTCKVNQRVLEDDEVQTLMAAKNIIHIKGDLTSYDETLTRWLAKFDRAGVPLYVLYRPGEEPYIFPELISVRLLVREFERVAL